MEIHKFDNEFPKGSKRTMSFNYQIYFCSSQEVEPSVGEMLCRMFEEDTTIDLSRVARHLKQRKKLGSTSSGSSFPRRDPPR